MLNVAGGVTDERVCDEDGFAHLDAKDFERILVDLRMRDMHGHAAIERIRRSGDDKARLPIVAITADLAGPSRARCMHLNVYRFVIMAVVMDELFSCIGEILGAGGRDRRVTAQIAMVIVFAVRPSPIKTPARTSL